MFLRLVFAMLLLLSLPNTVFPVEIMPLNEVKPGMIGEVRTVFKGTEIKSFPVEIVSVIKSTRGDRHFILVRAYGPLIEKLGGIAAGMSGSPVYVKGKIIGAIGYGWKMSDHRLGLVTPIEEMMRVWGRKEGISPLEEDVILRERKDAQEEKMVMFATGLSPRGVSLLSSDFERYGVRVVSFPSSGGEIRIAEGVKLEPGSAVGALLSCGDINIGAIGTLSYVEGGKFLAFAHPFLLRGKVNYFLTTAYIHECISSIEFPFKLGTPGEIIGTVSQDRLEAIGGVLRRYPLSIPIKFRVRNLDDGKERTSFVRVVYDDGILEDLLKSIFLSTFDLGWGKIGEGTVKLSYKVEGRNMPYTFERVNYFYSDKDTSKEAFNAFKEDFFTILYNEFVDVFPLGVTVDAEFTSRPKVLWIKDVSLPKKEVSRGEDLEVKLTLLSYRGKSVEKTVKVHVPEDFPEGDAFLLVRGGGIMPGEKNQKAQEEPKIYKSIRELLDDLKKQENNNEIIVEVISKSGGGEKEEKKEDSPRKEKKEAKSVFDTDFYVEGYIEKEVSVR